MCDATETSTSSETSAMMDEMGRLGAMWEESWHATLADLQVCEVLDPSLRQRSHVRQCPILHCKIHMHPYQSMS